MSSITDKKPTKTIEIKTEKLKFIYKSSELKYLQSKLVHREVVEVCKALMKKNPTIEHVAIPNTVFHHISGSFVIRPKCLS